MRDSALREDTTPTGTTAESDGDVAAAFATRAQADHDDVIDQLVAFGDAIRDNRGVHAAVELLVVLETETDEALEEHEQQLEALAETVGIEHDTVVELYVLPADRVESASDHPFITDALEGGEVYV
ncbi:hypothetical protein G6M89_14030 [Natronolimnobius sp. AArcel1]|uniref:hypothetical protein n=1 Tax=Natronolimnobius sp. AArcel1 TaxID=1679093 RepID=UPI0013EE08C3|nr:hypothetical protein [Natronolimnobius sp. AArcel1]NGM70112.1 hypothetical protein [Natronolimnobius sp. AArcel1]